MDTPSIAVYNSEGKEIDTMKLNANVFDGSVNKDAVYQAVRAYRAGQRQGTAATKTRGEVSGGGKKPWKQKGTGRARVGSTRSPLWRHGGVTFGPHPRDFSFSIPQKIKSLALRSALNDKINNKNFVVLDAMSIASAKTKDAARIFGNLKLISPKVRKSYSILVVDDTFKDSAYRALSNIAYINIKRASDINVYEVVSNDKVLITKDGVESLTKRLNMKKTTKTRSKKSNEVTK